MRRKVLAAMARCADLVEDVLLHVQVQGNTQWQLDAQRQQRVSEAVRALCREYPLPGIAPGDAAAKHVMAPSMTSDTMNSSAMNASLMRATAHADHADQAVTD